MTSASPSERPVAIVTGAGSGIGRKIVERLTADGVNCVAIGRRVGPLEETAAGCRAQSERVDLDDHDGMIDEADEVGEVMVLAADLSEPTSPGRLVESVLDRFGRIDAIVNNAARGGLMAFPAWSESDLDALIQTNLRGPIRLVQAAFDALVASAGRVVNLSSMAVVSPFEGNGAYGITKSALDGFTRALHADTARTRVKAISLALGAVETPMLRTVIDTRMLPPERAMSPASIANLVAAVLRGEHDDRAGQVLFVPVPDCTTTCPQTAMDALTLFHSS